MHWIFFFFTCTCTEFYLLQKCYLHKKVLRYILIMAVLTPRWNRAINNGVAYIFVFAYSISQNGHHDEGPISCMLQMTFSQYQFSQKWLLILSLSSHYVLKLFTFSFAVAGMEFQAPHAENQKVKMNSLYRSILYRLYIFLHSKVWFSYSTNEELFVFCWGTRQYSWNLFWEKRLHTYWLNISRQVH